jgi:hypothetical protein
MPYANAWQCIPGCDVIVQFGFSFGRVLACAPNPPTCTGDGEAPTFNYQQLQWGCQPECDGGTYDPHDFGSQTVCVPC